jgi:hypothetical protein
MSEHGSNPAERDTGVPPNGGTGVPPVSSTPVAISTAQPAATQRPSKPRKPKKPRRPFKQTAQLVFVRLYTFALLSVIAFVCLSAIVYLFKFVFTPAKLPAQFSQWQGRLDPGALRQPDVPGVTGEAGRAPMSHYHKVDRWFQPDPKNSCTASGCHSPLPHDKKSKIAAFPNLHVTFLDCTVCHEKTDARPVAAKWWSTVRNEAQDVPAVLRLGAVLETLGTTRQDAEKAEPQIAALLRESIASIGPAGSRELEDLLIEIESTVPDSPVWRLAVKHLAFELPLHARGEYSAKIVLKSPTTDAAKLTAQTKTFLTTPAGEARDALKAKIHETVVAKPEGCSRCHVKDNGMLDFAALGYSTQRAETLRALPLARMVERIREGESFQLPKVMEGSE